MEYNLTGELVMSASSEQPRRVRRGVSDELRPFLEILLSHAEVCDAKCSGTCNDEREGTLPESSTVSPNSPHHHRKQVPDRSMHAHKDQTPS
jgi:hypothetical protein